MQIWLLYNKYVFQGNKIWNDSIVMLSQCKFMFPRFNDVNTAFYFIQFNATNSTIFSIQRHYSRFFPVNRCWRRYSSRKTPLTPKFLILNAVKATTFSVKPHQSDCIFG